MISNKTHPVRVRFAPSPTGHLHVGGARTALYNWMFTKASGGQFILRSEDTDLERSTKEAEDAVLQDLKWLGIHWDEGPGENNAPDKGPHGPYRQSQRIPIYKKYADMCLEKNLAYECFCSDESLEAKRLKAVEEKTVPQYDGTCRNLTAQERRSKRDQKIPFTVRFKVDERDQTLHDLIRGTVVFKAGMVGDFVLLRSNGLPTYNFANVIDDGLMEITHVIRAEEHLSNTNRQLMLYEALGFKAPQFAHLSLVLGKDEEGNVSKLSKRHGATSVDQYKQDGFLPEAMVNYLMMLGWSHPDGKDLFSEEELSKVFSIERIGHSPSIFDAAKLLWVNTQYIHQLSDKDLFGRLIPYITPKHKWFIEKGATSEFIQVIMPLFKKALHRLDEINIMLDDFHPAFSAPETFSEETKQFVATTPLAPEVVRACASLLQTQPHSPGSVWPEADFKSFMDSLKSQTGAKGKALFMGCRVAITGQCHGWDLDKMLRLIGPQEAARRASLMAAKLLP